MSSAPQKSAVDFSPGSSYKARSPPAGAVSEFPVLYMLLVKPIIVISFTEVRAIVIVKHTYGQKMLWRM